MDSSAEIINYIRVYACLAIRQIFYKNNYGGLAHLFEIMLCYRNCLLYKMVEAGVLILFWLL